MRWEVWMRGGMGQGWIWQGRSEHAQKTTSAVLGLVPRDWTRLASQRPVVAAHGRSLQAPSVGSSKGRTLPGSRVGSKRHLGLTRPMSTCELGTAHSTAVVVERVPVAFSLFFFLRT